MFQFTDEQREKFMSSFDNYINERVKKGIQEFDITLSTVIDKLSPEGWTLPASLNIYAVNVIGQTDEIQDINEFLKWHFTHDEYSVLKDIMDKIQNSEIRDGLKKVIDECWCAFQINIP